MFFLVFSFFHVLLECFNLSVVSLLLKINNYVESWNYGQVIIIRQVILSVVEYNVVALSWRLKMY